MSANDDVFKVKKYSVWVKLRGKKVFTRKINVIFVLGKISRHHPRHSRASGSPEGVARSHGFPLSRE